ncbi:MAG: hypothetical protein CBC24_09165 [Candidatus Pelagibacter sp. TMED64]|nr:MAG: hypothetical protein CBC24_09165 [Candidatus Pelagibacter sp. TMED64]|tara:strand:+ start:2340 stop:2561 length:222 start_codon:yes stop_codon:yes gene_type:complete
MGRSRAPQKSAELTEAELAEKERLRKEKESLALREQEQSRIRDNNLLGFRSLLGNDEIDMRGHRRKTMGKTSP